MMKTYQVIKPLLLEGHGLLDKDAEIKLDPRQATFLITGGWLKEIKPKTPYKWILRCSSGTMWRI